MHHGDDHTIPCPGDAVHLRKMQEGFLSPTRREPFHGSSMAAGIEPLFDS